MTVKIIATKDGPYLGGGDLSQLELVDSTGQKIDLGAEKKIWLCRCGASTIKPFCDGTHTEVGFAAAEAAAQLPTG